MGLLLQEGLTSRESQAGTMALVQKVLKLPGTCAIECKAVNKMDRGSKGPRLDGLTKLQLNTSWSKGQ